MMKTRTRKPRVPAAFPLNQQEAAIYMAITMGLPKHRAEERMGLHRTSASRLTQGMRAKLIISMGTPGIKGSVKLLKKPHEVIFPGEQPLDPAYFNKGSIYRKPLAATVAGIMESKEWDDAYAVADLMEDITAIDNPDAAFLRQNRPMNLPVDDVLPAIAPPPRLQNPIGYGNGGPSAPEGLLPARPEVPPHPKYDGPVTAEFRSTPEFAAYLAATQAYYASPEFAAYMKAKAELEMAHAVWRGSDPDWIASDLSGRLNSAFYSTPEYREVERAETVARQRERERHNYVNPFDTWAEQAIRIMTRVASACSA